MTDTREPQENSDNREGAALGSSPPAEEQSAQRVTEEVNIGPFLDETVGKSIQFKSLDRIKEEAAVEVAKMIIYIFAAALIGSFGLVLVVFGLASCYPKVVTETIVPAMGGSVLEAIKVTGTLFSPLLAFILGYYFSASTAKGKKPE